MKDKTIGQFSIVRVDTYKEPFWKLKHIPTDLFTGAVHRLKKHAIACATEIQETGILFNNTEEMEPHKKRLSEIIRKYQRSY